jgi:dTDP-4-dehydrorhamnose 3,5-epimerase-like enzyme
MANIINIPVITDGRGSLGVVEKVINFNIKRVYFIYNTNGQPRGGHRHKRTRQFLVCLHGSCKIYCQNKLKESKVYCLDNPNSGLIIEPSDWHSMKNFSSDCVLLALASEFYDKNDYINDKY